MGEKVFMAEDKIPSESLTDFLNFIDKCNNLYSISYANMTNEDKRLQDLLHKVELAPGEAERNVAAVELQESRRIRRKNKDQMQLCEKVVEFFSKKEHTKTLEKMKQLLEQQRKVEEYLFSERTYKPRAE